MGACINSEKLKGQTRIVILPASVRRCVCVCRCGIMFLVVMKKTIILLVLIWLGAEAVQAQTTDVLSSTLSYQLVTNAAAYAVGHLPNADGEREVSGWDYRDYGGTNFFLLSNVVWSSSFWLKGVHGLSATPIGISNGLAGQGMITMISPRHYLHARHMGVLHTMAAFLGTNNVIYLRYPLEQAQAGPDTDVGILNEDVPPSVGYLPIIPANYANWLPVNEFVQGIGMNQDLQLFGQPMALGNTFVTWNTAVAAPNGLSSKWNVTIRGGDSSLPEMLLIHNQLVLVSHNYFAQGGPNYASQIELINRQMHYLSTNNNVGSDYQLTQYSFTNWPVIHIH